MTLLSVRIYGVSSPYAYAGNVSNLFPVLEILRGIYVGEPLSSPPSEVKTGAPHKGRKTSVNINVHFSSWEKSRRLGKFFVHCALLEKFVSWEVGAGTLGVLFF